MTFDIPTNVIPTVMPTAIASGLAVSFCSISAPSGAFTPGGEPVTGSGSYMPVAGLQNIPCMDAPPSVVRVQATEQKTESEILSLQFRHVWLTGYYPQIPTNDANWQAMITNANGTLVYDLLGAESDSQLQMTRLELRIASI